MESASFGQWQWRQVARVVGELSSKVSEMAQAVGWCPGQSGITHAQKGMLCDLYQCHWGYLADNKLTVYSERKYAAVVMLKLSNRGTHVDVYAPRRSKCCLFRLDDLQTYDVVVEFVYPVPAGTFIDLTCQ